MGDFYGTGIEFWAGFGPVGITEKKTFGPIMSNFWGRFFQVFIVKKIKNKTLVKTENIAKYCNYNRT